MELSSRCTAEGPTVVGGDSERDRALLSSHDRMEQQGEIVLNGMRVRPQAKHDTRTTEVVWRRCALPLSGEDTLCTLKGEILVLSGFGLQKTFE